MDDTQPSSLFAGRYRFETIDDDWDTGRSGFTHPAFDTQENRRVVIKRADATSPQSEQHERSLKNEAATFEDSYRVGSPRIVRCQQG